MKKRTGDDWFPFWIDKWLLGSTRDELTIEQCAVWVDFLALSYKDEGYIRANDGIPYPIKRLSGLLNRPVKLIQQTIDRCLEPKINKLRLESDGTLYVISHPEYELSKRHKRRLSEGDVRQKGHDVQKKDAKSRVEKSREEKSRIDKRRVDTHMSTSFKNDVIFKWNGLAQKYNLPAIKEIEPRSLRERNLRARSTKKGFDFDLLLDMIEHSPFLLGKTKHAFFVFFDWVIKPSNYQKIMEGNYLDRQGYQKFSGIVEGIKELEEKYRKEGRK
ncbi:hypothetical protein ES703_09605 [subsurface metagenome]